MEQEEEGQLCVCGGAGGRPCSHINLLGMDHSNKGDGET